MEAVIAAIYKDGGFEVAKTIIINLWGDRIKNVKGDARDAKTMLQSGRRPGAKILPTMK